MNQMRYMNIPQKNIRRRRLLLFVPIIVIIVFLYVIGYKASAARREATGFINSTNSITNQSNYLAKHFRAALSVKKKDKFLTESLSNMVDEALSHAQKAEAIEAPKDFKLAHSYFVVAMKLRHEALESYSRPLISSFSKNNEKSSNNKTEQSLADITLSDIAYKYYLRESKRYLEAKSLKLTLQESVFTPSKTIKKRVAETKEEKKKNPLGDADIFIDDVATEPLRIGRNPENDVRVLPDAPSIDLKVRVGNKGKVVEKDVPVEVTLKNGSKTLMSKKEVIEEIKPNKTKRVTIKKFKPYKEGVNVFEIKAGPLYSEKNEEDNNYTYKFIFKSQDSSASSED